VPASAPNPVYARYLAWLATPSGLSFSRQLSGSQAGEGDSGRSRLIAMALLALGAAALGVSVLFARKRPRVHRKPGWNGLPEEPTGTTFPASASSQEHLPNSDLAYHNPVNRYLPLGENIPYRVPPYMSAQDPGWYSPSGTSLLLPDDNNP
jgi:hypothetical protein